MPDTVIGVDDTVKPDPGEVIVGAILGAVAGILPLRPTELAAGGGLAAKDDIDVPASSMPATIKIKTRLGYDVC